MSATTPLADENSARPVGIRYRLEYAVFRAAFASFAALPRSVSLRLGAGLGELFYRLDLPHRRVAMLNLGLAFPDKPRGEHKRILRASCRNLGRLAAEVAQMARLDAAALERTVCIPDREAWDRRLGEAKRTGAVVLTGHFGNWELLAHAHALLGYPVTLVYRPQRNRLVDGALAALRSRAGTRVLAKKAAARDAIRALREGGLLVVATDQNQTRSAGVFVRFFGIPASTNPGAARLAMRTGVPVIPAFLVREGESDRHRVEILPDVPMQSTGNREEDIVANTQRCSDVIEAMIRRYPEQWIWFHKRWRTRPKGEARMY